MSPYAFDSNEILLHLPHLEKWEFYNEIPSNNPYTDMHNIYPSIFKLIKESNSHWSLSF